MTIIKPQREYHVQHISGKEKHLMVFHGNKTLDEIAQAFSDEYEKSSGNVHAIRLDKKKTKHDQKPSTILIISVDPLAL